MPLDCEPASRLLASCHRRPRGQGLGVKARAIAIETSSSQAATLALRTLRSVYSRPGYVALNVAAFVVYYFAYYELIAYQNLGVFLSNVSSGLLYGLVLTSSVLLTIAVYSIRNTRDNKARVSATTLGTVAAVFGGVIGGCGCSVPIISSLAVLGLSASEVVSLNNFLSDYQNQIFGVMIVANLAVILYYLYRLSTASCRLR